MRRHRVAGLRTARPAAVGLTLCATLALGLAGCTSGGPEPIPTTQTTSPSPSPSPSPIATAPVSHPATASASQPPEPSAPVELTGHGVGSIPDDTPDALPALEALLGPAESIGDMAECGQPFITLAVWGDLRVSLNDGALFGWQLGGTDRPAEVVLPFGTDIGTPFSQVRALPGASDPGYLDNYQVHVVDLDGVEWWFLANTPESPVTTMGHQIVGCG